MTCTNPEMGKLIGRYEFDLLSAEEKNRFELHIMECEACFEDLYSLTPAVKAMRENAELYLEKLAAKEPFYTKLKRSWDEGVEALSAVFRIRPRLIRVAVPVVATAILAIVVMTTFMGQPGDYGRLAIIEKDFYKPIAIRAGVDYEDYEILFHEGMGAYAEGDYSQAIKKLSESVRLNPNYAKGQFYLGLTYLLKDKIDEAIQHLEKAVTAAVDDTLLEKAHWYLGNAYLKKENGSRALEEFRKVVEFDGRFRPDAEEMMEKIEKTGD